MSSAVVAIVGRPNVGKSTLFNRFVGKRKAIESDIPGTTRDRLYSAALLDGFSALVVDTGGIELGKTEDDIEANVQEQSKVAIDGADVILFMVDVRQELTSEDFHAAELLRKSKKPVILVANKCDNPSFEEYVFNFYELGFGEPIAITASHSYGLDKLESRVGDELKALDFEREPVEEVDEWSDGAEVVDPDGLGSSGGINERIKIAFLGRPNAGKSTMVNALLGKDAVVVSDVPGTTRDASEIDFEYEDAKFTLIDTAGLRRRGKIEKGLEKYSVLRTMQAVEEADICVLMLDFIDGIVSQDCHVSQYILEQRKGLILVVNKIDLEDGPERDDLENFFIRNLKSKMAYLPWAPVVFSSALKRKNVFAILDLAKEVARERAKEISREDLAVWLEMALAKHPPKGARGKRRFDVRSVEQVGTRPPKFVFYCEWPEYMHFSYARYLENELRAQFGFNGVAIKLVFKKPGRG
jgi:GTPase